MDLLGRKIVTLADEVMEAGYHERMFDASVLPSGQYFYVLQTPTQSVVKIMMLMK
jgi:hypothetical protein